VPQRPPHHGLPSRTANHSLGLWDRWPKLGARLRPVRMAHLKTPSVPEPDRGSIRRGSAAGGFENRRQRPPGVTCSLVAQAVQGDVWGCAGPGPLNHSPRSNTGAGLPRGCGVRASSRWVCAPRAPAAAGTCSPGPAFNRESQADNAIRRDRANFVRVRCWSSPLSLAPDPSFSLLLTPDAARELEAPWAEGSSGTAAGPHGSGASVPSKLT